MIGAVPQGEEELTGGQAVRAIAAHADCARMGIQGGDLRVKLKFIGNQILGFLFAESGVAHIDPAARDDALDGVVIHETAGGHVNKAVHCVRRCLGQQLNHNPFSVFHI